jgi:hypothetical protein
VCCAFTRTTPDAALLQNVVQRDPVHARGLHRHRIDAARLKPFRHPDQGICPAAEFPHRIRVSIRRRRRKVALIAHVDASGVAIYDHQFGVARSYLPS